MAKESLYGRLGGYNIIAAVVDDIMRRMTTDARLIKYFVGHSEDSKKRLRQLLVDMVCQATGGPCFYLGRDMKTAHKGLGITGTEWQSAMTHIVGVMDNFKVSDAEQREVLAFLNSIKGDIVEKT